jgi:hypothetical protein
MSYRLTTESGKIISNCLMSYVHHDDYLQADRRKEVKDFNRRIEASLDDANFNGNGGELDNLHLQNMNDDLTSGERRENDETTPNPGLRGHEYRRNDGILTAAGDGIIISGDDDLATCAGNGIIISGNDDNTDNDDEKAGNMRHDDVQQ